MLIKKVNKAAQGHNRYCGPAVVSILTGCDTAQAARLLREVSGKRSVKGTTPRQVLDALEARGVVPVREMFPGIDARTALNTGTETDLQWHEPTCNHKSSANWRASQYNAKHAPTLAAWLKATKDERTAGRVYLLVAGLHWLVVSGRRYVCGITGDIVSIKDKRVRRRARVTGAWEVTKA
jgi:hypothetical protein